MTAKDAQNDFGRLLDMVQSTPVRVTRNASGRAPLAPYGPTIGGRFPVGVPLLGDGELTGQTLI